MSDQTKSSGLPSMDITRREYYIGQALAGLCANPGIDIEAKGVAHDAILFADAVLILLEEEQLQFQDLM
jgi:hypothetical protein